ncbi:MAG: methyltransferase domain-containing protein [Thauera sp.]|jgi:SAM-dependent methyltransferase|nr:methyltransferase domain-containing protein [Thauera sp.]
MTAQICSSEVVIVGQHVKWEKRVQVDAACLVCGNPAGNALVLSAMHWRPERGQMRLLECARCRSCFYPDAAELNSDYPSLESVLADPDFPILVHHYLEIVGGLDWKVWLLEQLPFEQFSTVLEVGCNAGVTLDYCRLQWGADVVGLEPSAYGVVGGEMLELPILPKYMSKAEELSGRTFDFIYATEVLEHVPDPAGFLRELRSFLAPGGVLLLTTPRSGAVSRATPVGQLYAALSPGSHYFLLSPNSLRALLEGAGFSFVEITDFGMTNVALASDADLVRQACPDVAERLKEYYAKALDRGGERVRLGNLINYYVFASRCGEFDPHREFAARIDSDLDRLFGIDLRNPESLIDAVLNAGGLVDFGKVMPYALPFFLEQRARNESSNPVLEEEIKALAALLMARGLQIDFQNLFVYHEAFERCWRGSLPRSSRAIALHAVTRDMVDKVPELAAASRGFVARVRRKVARVAEGIMRQPLSLMKFVD